MKKLLKRIENARKDVKNLVNVRIKEFEEMGKKPINEIFKELCFCILTANFNAERTIKIQQEIGNGFLTFTEEKLAEKLKHLGHRYPNARANYIVEARKHIRALKKLLDENPIVLREWLVKNVKGIGYKEASHFLRNIGHKNFAIIDFHIIDILTRHKIIKPMSLSKRNYMKIEKILSDIAKKLNITTAELDLYLWYIETGKVLK